MKKIQASLMILSLILITCAAQAETLKAQSGSQQLKAAAGNPAQALPREISSDTNKDGKPDRWERYENGVLVSIEADANQDGTIDERGVIESGRLVRVEKDSDFDGKTDRWIKY